MIVHTKCHTLYGSIVVGRTLGIAGVGVICFVATEDVQFLIILTHRCNLREHVVTSFDTHSIGILRHKGRVLVRRLRVQAVIHIFQLFCITQIAIVGLSANNPVVGFIREVEGTNSHYAFVFRIHAIGIARIAVSDAMTIVSAESYAQARNSVVIQTKRYAILIGNVELQW